MWAKLHAKATFANVVSLLALFVALGGTSYAAIKITGSNVKNGSLTGADIKKSSVQLNRLKGALPAGLQGPKGDPGAKGAAGTNGTNGTPGTNGTNASTHVVVRAGFVNSTYAAVNCNTGETVTGGGAYADGGVIGSKPAYTAEGEAATGWQATAASTGLGTYVYVMCASP